MWQDIRTGNWFEDPHKSPYWWEALFLPNVSQEIHNIRKSEDPCKNPHQSTIIWERKATNIVLNPYQIECFHCANTLLSKHLLKPCSLAIKIASSLLTCKLVWATRRMRRRRWSRLSRRPRRRPCRRSSAWCWPWCWPCKRQCPCRWWPSPRTRQPWSGRQSWWSGSQGRSGLCKPARNIRGFNMHISFEELTVLCT